MEKIKYQKGTKTKPKFLKYKGKFKELTTKLQLFTYNFEELTECKDENSSDIIHEVDYRKVNWLNIHGLTNTAILTDIVNFLEVDHFILSDILNTNKRTKLDEYPNILFLNIKSLINLEEANAIEFEQISFILKDGILTSFQEKSNDFFSPIRERIRTHYGYIREKKVDYLLYLLLDVIIENFHDAIDIEENRVEELINISKASNHPEILDKIEMHRDNLNLLKRALAPLIDSLYSIKSINEDGNYGLITKESNHFFDRLHQKTLELLEQIDYNMISLNSTSNYYFSAQGQKMNEVMKTLTVVSVFFMPLTFIVGIYGMNFDNMPELHWKYGYFIILMSMILLLLAMIIYFKKRKWF